MGTSNKLQIAVQMDHIASIDPAGDTTFALMLEAQSRGHQLLHYTVDRLAMGDGHVTAAMEPVSVVDQTEHFYSLGAAAATDLADVDCVLMRQDPPFDMGYITATHLLERVHPATFVMNNPKNVRNAPEKIFVTEFPDLMPPTLITRDADQIREFRDEFGDIIIKPLYGNGGAGVFQLSHQDQNLSSLIEMFSQQFPEPFVIQQYLKDVRAGDKRIILVDGEIAGAINRVPAAGESRSNMHVGGRPEPTKLTEREREICARIGPALKASEFILVGIDVIGDYMTEINVTSPTGLREVQRFDGINIAAQVIDCLEQKTSR